MKIRGWRGLRLWGLGVTLSGENAWVSNLLDPAVWPHPVNELRMIQTHISLVILTGKFAYKLKKPVELGFLDFSTLAARQHFCLEELRLNRRLAPEIYLDVIAIGGSPASPRPGSSTGVFEYAVKMRQFPQSAQLDNMLSAGAVTPAHVDAVADMVANFHRQAVICADAGSAEAALIPFRDNLKALQECLGPWQTGQALGVLRGWLHTHEDRLAEVFERRRQDGFVRDGHGDLHLRNLAWIDGLPVAFDCIEFDSNLRRIDVMSDLAFAVMDLHFRGQPEYAQRLFNRYLETGGDYKGLETMDFYLAYRATVRAKVDAIRADQEDDEQVVADCRRSVQTHMALAEWFVRDRQPMVILTRGMSGSGKSYVSRRLLAPLDAIRIRSDVERKRLEGIKASDSAAAQWGQGLYSAEMTAATYERLAELVQIITSSGRTVIVDATFKDANERHRFRTLAEKLNLPIRILEFTAPPELLRARVRARRGDASDADLSILERQLKCWQPISSLELDIAIEIDTAVEIDPDVLCRRLTADIRS